MSTSSKLNFNKVTHGTQNLSGTASGALMGRRVQDPVIGLRAIQALSQDKPSTFALHATAAVNAPRQIGQSHNTQPYAMKGLEL